MHHRGALFRGYWGSGVRDMALPLLGNLGAKFSEMSFPHFKTYYTQIGRCYLFNTQQFKMIDSNEFYSVLNVLIPKCLAHYLKRKSCKNSQIIIELRTVTLIE